MANANLSGEETVRSCGPRTRCRDPFQQLEDHLEEFLTTEDTGSTEEENIEHLCALRVLRG